MGAAQGFPVAELDAVDAVVEHLNGRHADTVALMARVGTTPVEGDEAEITAVDRCGALIAVGPSSPLDRPTVRLPFAEAIDTADGLRAQLFSALAIARSVVGESRPPTSLEREVASNAAIPMHRARVDSVAVLSPNLIQVTLGGLHGFNVLGPDTFAFAIVDTGDGPLNETFTISDYQQARADGRARGAYYTVRRWNPDQGAVTFWVVVHGHDDGLASWFASARPDDELLLWGPRRGFIPPPDADHLLLVADETGFAAVASIIEATPTHSRIDAVLESVDAAHRPPMPGHPGLNVRWVDRHETPPGASDGLVDAVLALDTASGVWAAFGGAESRLTSRIRKHLRGERGLPASHVSMTGYWRSG